MGEGCPISAKTWDSMGSLEIIRSIEVGLRVLGRRRLGDDELGYLALIIADIVGIIREGLRRG